MTLQLFRPEEDTNTPYEWALLSKPEAITLLRTKIHTSEQIEAFNTYPQKDVLITKGRVTLQQVNTGRPSYINALIIQSRGIEIPGGCRNSRSGVFATTVRLPGYFGGCCGNCKFKDHGARCSVRNPGEPKLLAMAEIGGTRVEEVEEVEDDEE